MFRNGMYYATGLAAVYPVKTLGLAAVPGIPLLPQDFLRQSLRLAIAAVAAAAVTGGRPFNPQ
jgi:hypothetical protein